MNQDNLRKAAGAIAGKRILLVGDFIADENWLGETSRISREAPVLILEHKGRELFPGGAANAANNLLALGAHPILVGALGEDEVGEELIEHFKEKSTPIDGLLRRKEIQTTVKVRIFGGGPHTVRQQMIRIDRGSRSQISDSIEAEICDCLERRWAEADAVIVSDYGYGVVGERVRDWILKKNAADPKILMVDSRYALDKFTGVTGVTPNEPEAESLLGRKFADRSEIEQAGQTLLERLACRSVLITRGPKGMALFEKDRPTDWIPVFGTDEVADVTGAGDTVIAAYTAALAGGASFGEAARLANLAGGVVVLKQGTAVVAYQELLDAIGKWHE